MATTSRVDILLNIQSKLAGLDNTLNRLEKTERQSRKLGALFKSGLGIGFGIASFSQLANIIKATGFESVRLASRLNDVSNKLGISTDFIQSFNFAASQTGTNTNAAEMALQRFSRRLGEASQGKGELLPILKQYNVAITDSAGKTRAAEDVLGDLADIISKTQSPTERLRIAFKAFDSEGAGLVTVLKDGREGLRQWSEQAEKSGAIMEEVTIKRLARAENAIARFRTRATIIIGEALGEFGNSERIKAFGLQMQAEIARLGGQITAFGFNMQAEVTRFGGGLVNELANAATLIPRLIGAAFGVVATAFGRQLTELIANLKVDLLEFLKSTVESLPGDPFVDRIDGLITEAKRERTTLLNSQNQGGVGLYQQIRNAVLETRPDIVDPEVIEGAANEWEQAAKDVIENSEDAALELERLVSQSLDKAAEQDFQDTQSAANVGNFGGGQDNNIQNLQSVKSEAQQLDEQFQKVGLSISGISNNITGLGTGTQEWGQVTQQVALQIISSLVRIGVQEAALSVARRIRGSQETAQDIQQTTARLGPKSAEAAATSIGSFGVASILGSIAALAAITLITGAIAGAFATGGETPGKPSLILVGEKNRKEFVVNDEAYARNKALVEHINAGGDPLEMLSNSLPSQAAVPNFANSGSGSSPNVSVEGHKANVVLVRDNRELAEFLETSEGESMVIDIFKRNKLEISG